VGLIGNIVAFFARDVVLVEETALRGGRAGTRSIFFRRFARNYANSRETGL
jgi:hypothetical protein